MEKEINSINFETLDRDIDLLLSNISEANELHRQVENTLVNLNNIEALIDNEFQNMRSAINKSSIEQKNTLDDITKNVKTIEEEFDKMADIAKTQYTSAMKLLNSFEMKLDDISTGADTNNMKLSRLINEKTNENHTKLNEIIENSNDSYNKLMETNSNMENNYIEKHDKLVKKINYIMICVAMILVLSIIQ